MTPKEKAIELVGSYVDIMPSLDGQTGDEIMKHAKECATLAVKELVALSKWTASSNRMAFWENVENEIQNINWHIT